MLAAGRVGGVVALEGYFSTQTRWCQGILAVRSGWPLFRGRGGAFKRVTTVMVDNVNIHKTVHQSMVAGYTKVRVMPTIFYTKPEIPLAI